MYFQYSITYKLGKYLYIFHICYTRSSDSAPLISAILRLVLIGKLPKSSFSALLELNTKSFLLRLVLFFGLIQTVLPQLVLCFCWPEKSAVRGKN